MSSLRPVLTFIIVGLLAGSALSVVAPSYGASPWYSVKTLHGVPRSIQISEPSYTLQIANGSRFRLTSYAAFELNFTSNPNKSVCDGSVGEGCWWTEHVGCGCGSDQNPPSVRVWHILYADTNLLALQYNNTRYNAQVQPMDSYVMIFYRGSDPFVWDVHQKVTSTVSGWNGFDEATSFAVSGATTMYLDDFGNVVSKGGSGVTTTFSKTAQARLQMIQFVGVSSGSGVSIFEYPISTSSPYEYCSAGTNGEEKCSEVPNSSSGGQGGPFTFRPGWRAASTFVIYPTLGGSASAVRLSKALYASVYGTRVGFNGWLSPTFCDVNATWGGTVQGCSPKNNLAAGILSNGFSMWQFENGPTMGTLTFFNQTTLRQGWDNFSSLRVSMSDSPQNYLNGVTRPPNPASASDSMSNVSGVLTATTRVDLPSIKGRVNVMVRPNSNFYLFEMNSTVVGSVQVKNLTYSISLPGPTSSCDIASNEGSSFFRQINSSTWDYEYRDAVYGNWVGYVVGTYGHETGSGVSFVTYSNACHNHPVVLIYLLNDSSPKVRDSGTFGEALYVLPHFGNVTTVAGIDSRMSTKVTMEPETQMYQKPTNLALQQVPLLLEAQSSAVRLLYVNATVGGYEATVRMPPGTHTAYFLWNTAVAGTLTGVTALAGGYGATLVSQAPLAGGFYNVTVAWTSTRAAALLAFASSGGPTTTTSTVSTSASTSTPSSSASTTSTQSSSSTTTTSGGVTTISTPAVSTTSSTPTTSSTSLRSSTNPSGGIPEYPYLLPAAVLFTVLLVGAYALFRRRSSTR